MAGIFVTSQLCVCTYIYRNWLDNRSCSSHNRTHTQFHYMNLEGYDIKKPCCIHLSPLFYFFAVARQYLFVFNRYCDSLTCYNPYTTGGFIVYLSYLGIWSWIMYCWIAMGMWKWQILVCAKKIYVAENWHRHSVEPLTTLLLK